MTHGKDPMTYDIAQSILAEEIEHESWFLELLDGRPSGHMRRRYSGERPHTSKHSRSLDSLWYFFPFFILSQLWMTTKSENTLFYHG